MDHFHHDLISVGWITLSAIAGINVWRIIAAWLAGRNVALLQTLGTAMGSLSTFSA